MNFNDFQIAALRTSHRLPTAYPEAIRTAHQSLIIAALDAERHGGEGAGDFNRKAANDLLDAWDRMVNVAGLAGEAGEVADLLKKTYGHGHSLDRERLRSELGDVLYYVAVIADEHGLNLEECAAANVIKLQIRYPNGFTIEDSITKRDQVK